MKKIWISMATTMFLGTSLMLTSCGGNNGDMPPETTTGETQETGADYPEGMGTTTGDTIGTEGGTTAGGTTAGGTTAGGTTAGGTTAGGTTTRTTAGGTTTGTTAGGTTAGGTTTGGR